MPVSRAGRRRRCAATALGALLALSGCKDEKKAAAPAAAAAEPARAAAEQNIRTSLPSGVQMRFRGEQVYAQAIAQRVAVCGQVNPFADDARTFVPFVSLVTLLDAAASGAPQYKIEQYIGTTTSEAGRVYLAIVNYCYDKGGPSSGPIRSVMPMAPLPDSIPDPARSAAPPAAAAAPTPPAASARPAADSTPSSGNVTMRQAGNLHSDPHGPTIRIVPQGTALKVFAQATGGWYQVGDTAPWGWMHESMLDKR